MLTEFNNHIEKKHSFLKKGKLLLACSGGVDSIVLAHLCVRSALNVTLAHCNFNLRGSESDGDETFVKKLGSELKIPTITKSFDTKNYILKNGGSVQMAARALRYQWFEELKASEGFDFILTAHHLDDKLETFLINLSRGTGIDGLTGIPEQNKRVIRPLLAFSRVQILAYAKAEELAWREDSSNQDSKYLRNKVRHEIVPRLKEMHPSFLDNFNQTENFLNQTSTLVENYINQVRTDLFEIKGDLVKIKLDKLLKLQPIEAYLYKLFQSYGFTDWSGIQDLLTSMSGKEVVSKTHKLLKDRDYLILSETENEKQDFFIIEEGIEVIQNPISLKLEKAEAVQKSPKNVVFFDKEKLNYPLMLRRWEKGDYFYPYGMLGKKKLSKYFKDEKIDLFSKEKQWLLCSNNEIVWVVGMRSDNRFKVDDTTENILKVTLSV